MPASLWGDELLRRGERAGYAVRVLAAGLGERRLAAASAADVLAELAHDPHRVEPARDERLVEVDDEKRTPVVARRDDRALRLLLLADPVGEVAQRPAPE